MNETLLITIKDALRFRALESGDVDNWEWYSDSLHDFLKECELEDEEEYSSFEDVVKFNLKLFKKIVVENKI